MPQHTSAVAVIRRRLGARLDNGEPTDQVWADALLYRGVLCGWDDELKSLCLAGGLTEANLAFVSGVCQVKELSGHERWGWAASTPKIRAMRRAIKKLYPLERRRGSTEFGFARYLRGGGAGTYAGMHHGARTSLNSLDPGVALLVRTLPLIAVGTFLSCDGHGQAPMQVMFGSTWDAPWLRVVMERVPTSRRERVSRMYLAGLERELGWPDAEEGTSWRLEAATEPGKRDRLLVEPGNDSDLASMMDEVLSWCRVLHQSELHRGLRAIRQVALRGFDPGSPPEPEEWGEMCRQAAADSELWQRLEELSQPSQLRLF